MHHYDVTVKHTLEITSIIRMWADSEEEAREWAPLQNDYDDYWKAIKSKHYRKCEWGKSSIIKVEITPDCKLDYQQRKMQGYKTNK